MNYYLNLPEYLRARLKHLEGVKTSEQVAFEIGYDKARIIERFAAGDRVPMEKLMPLAKALGAPLLPIFRLGMLQFGPEWFELAEAICDRVAIAGHSLADPVLAKQKEFERENAADSGNDESTKAPDPEFDAHGPLYVDLCFDVPADFRREFRLEAIDRQMTYSELLLLSYQTYRTHRDPSMRNA